MSLTSNSRHALIRILAIVLQISGVGLLGFSIFNYGLLRSDSARLERLATRLAGDRQAPSEQMRPIVDYLSTELPSLNQGAYHLSPAFRFLRPTAAQVVDLGGNCANRSRAMVVLLHQLGTRAEKVALFDDQGGAYHSVARVATERGDYIVDTLYGVVYDHEDGGPMTEEFIAQNMAEIMLDELDRGNRLVRRYPVERGDFQRYGTNWTSNRLFRAVRAVLRLFMSDAEIRAIPRPYLMEEPAAIVALGSLLTGSFFVLAGLALRRARTR